MFKSYKKNKTFIVSITVLLIVYFVTRLINLTALPIFTDEAIYIRWAQIANQDSSWRFISLTDGKQPLFVWGAMIMLRFVTDPVVAGRIVSVFAGAGTLVGIGLLARELFKSTRTGIIVSFLYLTYPFALMYDRMALMDGMVAMFSVWSLYLAVILVRRPRLDVALLFGMVLGGATLTKTSGFLNIYLLPATLLLFDWQKKDRNVRLLTWFLFALLAVLLSQAYYSILRLSPWFHMIAQKDTTFLYTLTEWREHPFEFLYGNLRGELDWVMHYMTWSLLVSVLGALVVFWKEMRIKLLLLIMFSAPLVGLALFGKVLYPRFVLFMTMPLLLLVAWSFNYMAERIKQKVVLALVYVLLVSYLVYFDAKILLSIITAPLPRSDAGQYVNDWPSGWGIRESVDFLAKEVQDKEITLFTEGNFGLLPYGIEIYLVDDPNLEIIGIWPVPNEYTDQMEEKIAEEPVYYISNREQELPWKWKAELIGEWNKGSNTTRKLRLWKLMNNES